MLKVRRLVFLKLSLMVVMSAVALLMGLMSVQAASPTVTGREVVTSPLELPGDSVSPKQRVVYCPANKRVIGGGGQIHEIGAFTGKPALTELRPAFLYDGTRDAYIVTAAETTPGTTTNWFVEAYAVCTDPLPGLYIASATTSPSSSSVQGFETAKAVCGGGWVIGTGGRTSIRTGEVVLQVARPSGPGDIARVQAHETANGYAGIWSVTSYAICAPTKPAGYEVVFGESPQRLSETFKSATATCPAGKQLLSSGAAISKLAPGNVSLHSVMPDVSDPKTRAWAVENTPTSLNWDFIVATAICAQK